MTRRRLGIAGFAVTVAIASASVIWWKAAGRPSPAADDAGVMRIVAAPAEPPRPAPIATTARPPKPPVARAQVDPDPPAPPQEAAAPRHAEIGVGPAI